MVVAIRFSLKLSKLRPLVHQRFHVHRAAVGADNITVLAIQRKGTLVNVATDRTLFLLSVIERSVEQEVLEQDSTKCIVRSFFLARSFARTKNQNNQHTVCTHFFDIVFHNAACHGNVL